MTKIFNEYQGFEGTTYHAEGVVCQGCKKTFCYTVKEIEDSEEKYCMLCYNHRFGEDEMKKVNDKLDDLGNYLWETPIAEIKPEIKKELNFIGKPQ